MQSTTATTYLDSGLHALPPPPSFPSPDFTNPDLLLPDKSHSRCTSTPSPPPSSDLPPSPSQLLRQLRAQPIAPYDRPRTAAAGPLSSFNFYFGERRSHSALGVRTRTPSVVRPGARPLSDIEEVDVANPRGFAGLPPRTGICVNAEAPQPSSFDGSHGAPQRGPGIRNGFASGFWKAREERFRQEAADGQARRGSDASSSVGSADLERLDWPGFDSLAEDDEEDEDVGKRAAKERPSSANGKPAASDGDETEYSDPQLGGDGDDEEFSASLSRRADIILANAKKRLNLMEGNLRGARHSLIITNPRSDSPSQGASSSSRFSTAGPPGSKLHQYSSPLAGSGASPGHSRVYSEICIGPLQSPTFSENSRSNSKEPRSTSALASSSLDAYMDRNSAIRGSRSHEVMRDTRLRNWLMSDDHQYHTATTPTSPATPTTPNRPASKFSSASMYHVRAPAPEAANPQPQVPSAVSRAAASAASNPRISHTHTSSTTSTASSLQLQMQDLKGRISSLKRRAAEEKARRSSLQATRTPSPNSAAETWYQSADSYRSGQWGIGQDAGIGWSMSTAGFRPESAMSDAQAEPAVAMEAAVAVVVSEGHSRQTSRSGVSFLEDSSIEAKSQAGSIHGGSVVEPAGASAVNVGAPSEQPKPAGELMGPRIFPLKGGSSRSTSRSSCTRTPLERAPEPSTLAVRQPLPLAEEDMVESAEEPTQVPQPDSFVDESHTTNGDPATTTYDDEQGPAVSDFGNDVELDDEIVELEDDFNGPTESDDGESEYQSAYGGLADSSFEGGPVMATTRHEDREDAFDYENFFLHSAMGTYSRERRNSSDSWRSGDSGSESDAGSEGTARAPSVQGNREFHNEAESEPPTPRGREGGHDRPSTAMYTNGPAASPSKSPVLRFAQHSAVAANGVCPFVFEPPRPGFIHERSPSVDSVSTFATFLTATEGNGSDEEEDSNAIDSLGMGWPSSTANTTKTRELVQGGRGNAWAQRRQDGASQSGFGAKSRGPPPSISAPPLLPGFQSPSKSGMSSPVSRSGALSPRFVPLPASPPPTSPIAATAGQGNPFDRIPVNFPLPGTPLISTDDLVTVLLGPPTGGWSAGESERAALAELIEEVKRAVGELQGLVQGGKSEADEERGEWRRKVVEAGRALKGEKVTT